MPTFKTTEEYQEYQKQRQELLGYCKKISQGIDNLEEKSGERAIWELVQNARDMDDNAKIRIELTDSCLKFSHHGKPFDYLSLLALVNQNSSKDNLGADLAGQYGTGFMTTHAFNTIVKVDGPYKAVIMEDHKEFIKYVLLDGFELNRSYYRDQERAIEEMRDEMKKVDEMYKKQPRFSFLPDRWTSFTYELSNDQLPDVSKQITSVARFMPFVLAINDRIKEVEINDSYSRKSYKMEKNSYIRRGYINGVNGGWELNQYTINNINLIAGETSLLNISVLQSKQGDVILLPPYPKVCGDVSSIPSLFLWFPLLGTEKFGVNFIFHSKRFYPVEKRNNILLPENVSTKIEKGRANESILTEMMTVLHEYYRTSNRVESLTRDMCIVNFKSDREDEVTQKFYEDLQKLWNAEIPSWRIIPTDNGRRTMNDNYVKVLHPDFYVGLSDEKRREYEPVLALFAKNVKNDNQETFLLPKTELLAWSETVNEWGCNRSDFFITIEDVCRSVNTKSEELHKFLLFLKESGNEGLLDKYDLLPNRKGTLCKKGSLFHAPLLNDFNYKILEPLMGNDANKIIDPFFLDVCSFNSFGGEDLQRSISSLMSQWRTTLLNNKIPLSEDQISALIKFCSASSQQELTNYRGRMMRQIVRVFGKEYETVLLPRFVEREDDFYNTAFYLLLDYTLYIISMKDDEWLSNNRELLLSFMREYSTSTADERLSKLDSYAVLPNYHNKLCLKKELKKNIDIDEKLTDIYQQVLNKDLRDNWICEDYKNLFTYEEQKSEDVARDITEELERGDYKDPIVLDIIEYAENEETDNWKKLFKSIFGQRETIRYNLGTDDERKAINKMMKQKNPALLEKLADISEREDANYILHEAKRIADREEREKYLQVLGDYVERYMEEFLTEKLSEFDICVSNQQGGQDFILQKGDKMYYIELKSRWESDQSVSMTKTQFQKAVNNPDNYALIYVNMYNYDQQKAIDDVPLVLSEIRNDIKVLNNIGFLEKELYDKVEEAYKETREGIRIEDGYGKINVPQRAFDAFPLDLDCLIADVIQKLNNL